MKITKLFPIVLALLITAPAALNAQPVEAEPEGKSYKLMHTIVVGSSASEAADELSPAVRAALAGLGPELGYESYSRVAALFGPLGTGGQANWKLMTRQLGSLGSENMPIVSEWSLGALEQVPGNPSFVEFKRFHFFARIPARIGESVNYESIQLTLNRIRAEVGKTSVIANLPVPETGEMLFFVLKIDEVR